MSFDESSNFHAVPSHPDEIKKVKSSYISKKRKRTNEYLELIRDKYTDDVKNVLKKLSKEEISAQMSEVNKMKSNNKIKTIKYYQQTRYCFFY